MDHFSYLFDKVPFIFRTCPLSMIRSTSTLYTRNRYLSCQSARAVRMTMPADTQQNQHDKYLLRVYNVEILLMMDSGPVRNMQSTLSNAFEKQCISLAFIIRTRYIIPFISVHFIDYISGKPQPTPQTLHYTNSYILSRFLVLTGQYGSLNLRGLEL